MIRSFNDKETEKIFRQSFSRKLPINIQKTALRKLIMLDVSASLDDIRVPPSNHLEPLRGDREGSYSIRVNDQYRICFRFENGDCYNVEIVDYH